MRSLPANVANFANLLQSEAVPAHVSPLNAAGADPVGGIFRACSRKDSFSVLFQSEPFSVCRLHIQPFFVFTSSPPLMLLTLLRFS